MVRLGLLTFVLILCNVAQAKTFEFTLYAPNPNDDGISNFFDDYDRLAQCTIEIDDLAIQSNAFIDVRDPAFLRFECAIPGNDNIYSFTYGSDVSFPDYWTVQDIPNFQFGLRFDGDAKPLRFDSPQILISGPQYGVFDSPALGFFGSNSTHTYWGPTINDQTDTFTGVLLEPATISGTVFPVGEFIALPAIPENIRFMPINGGFQFVEQSLRDADLSRILNPLVINNGIFTFEEELLKPTMRITQAVFQNDEPIRLVHERTTAIIVDRGFLATDRELHLVFTDITDPAAPVEVSRWLEREFEQGTKSGEIIFYCNESNNFCSLEDGGFYSFRIDLPSGEVVEEVINMETLRNFILPFILVSSPLCSGDCSATLSDVMRLREESKEFIQRVYPLPDDSIDVEPIDRLFGSSDSNRSYYIESPCRANNGNTDRILVSNAIWDDFSELGISRKLLGGKRVVGVVSPDYFSSLGYPSITAGLTEPTEPLVALVRSDSGPDIVAHEIGHTFNLEEGYRLNSDCEIIAQAENTSGFDVYASLDNAFVTGIDFMGSRSSSPRWVGSDNWDKLYTEVSKSRPDPQLLYISVLFSELGVEKIFPWVELEGSPDIAENGEYKIQLLDSNDVLLEETPFNLTFEMHIFPIGSTRSQVTRLSRYVNYYPETALVKLIDPEGNTLFEVDPAIQTLRSLVDFVPVSCLADQSGVEYAKIQAAVDSLSQAIQLDQNNSIATALLPFESFIESGLNLACPEEYYVYKSTSEFVGALQVNIDRLKRRHNIPDSPTPIPGDLDFDGDVDRDDLNILMASRNQPAEGEDDPKDLDGDGRITALDARRLTTLCTRPRCATQ